MPIWSWLEWVLGELNKFNLLFDGLAWELYLYTRATESMKLLTMFKMNKPIFEINNNLIKSLFLQFDSVFIETNISLKVIYSPCLSETL